MDHCSIQGQYNTYMYSYMYFIVYHVQLFKLCLFLFAEVSGNVMNVRQGSKGRRDQKLLEKRPERASEPRPDVSITRSQTGVRPRWTKTLTERRQRKGLPRRRKCPLLLGSLSDDLVTPQLDRADRLEPVARGTGGGDEGQRRVRGRRKCPRPGAGPHGGHHPTCLYVNRS